jgi:hypothetical protein
MPIKHYGMKPTSSRMLRDLPFTFYTHVLNVFQLYPYQFRKNCTKRMYLIPFKLYGKPYVRLSKIVNRVSIRHEIAANYMHPQKRIGLSEMG